MTSEQVVGYLLEGEGLDFLRESLSWVVQQLMEAEVSELVGAERGQRAPEERLTHRNGYRARRWDTRAGELELAIPKLRRGSYFPSFLEPRRRSEQALVSVVQEAYVAGVSTRKVDQVVESLGLRISKSEVSRICAGLDEQVDAFRHRPLEGSYPYLWLDAKVEKVRDGGRVVRKALVLAYGVHESGYREVIALDVGEAETEAFWRSFLRSLVERGLGGVRLVVSDAHAGLKRAIGQVLGCPWQRCSVHFLREALGHARREQQPMLAALLRPLFNAETGEQARELVGDALERLGKPLPKIAALLQEAEEDLLAFYAFPADHWAKLRSTNPLERVNREIGRRTDVVGIFPNDRSLIRLAASVVIEQNDEWLVGRRYLSAHSLEAVLDQREEDKDREETRELTPA
ncbi:MAG: IS256 family transposase [Thermoleophilaceae bacterium]